MHAQLALAQMFTQVRRIVRDGKGSPRKRLVAAILHVLLWPVLLLPRLFWPRRRHSEVIARILLIRMDGIGDLAMSAAIFPALRRHFPSAKIDLLTSREAAGVAELFVRAKWLDAVHLMPLRGRSIKSYRDLARQFRATRYDAAIDLRGDLRNILLIWLAGIPIRIGMPAAGLTYLLTDVVEVNGPHHQSEEPIALIKKLGVRDVDPSPHLPVDPDDQAAASRWLLEHGLRAGQPICAFHLSAFYPSKVWPLERFVSVARHLSERRGMFLLIVGGPNDVKLAQEFAKEFPPNAVGIAAGQVSLSLTAALLAQCAIFIGNDSGPAHLAAGVGCPVVVLFGPANPVEYRPLGKKVIFLKSQVSCDPHCGKTCVRGEASCMKMHSVEDVLEATDRITNVDVHHPQPG